MKIRTKASNSSSNSQKHGLRTPREEIVFTARPKIQSQIFRLFPLWASVVRGQKNILVKKISRTNVLVEISYNPSIPVIRAFLTFFRTTITETR